MSAKKSTLENSLTQLDRFKQAARDLECDDDEARFDERVKKVLKRKPPKAIDQRGR